MPAHEPYSHKIRKFINFYPLVAFCIFIIIRLLLLLHRTNRFLIMLRKTRIILALIFWIGITMLFLDFTGTFARLTGWMAKIQFVPALLSLNFIVVSALLVLTLLFGRIYCSVVCPLGVTQDIFARFGRIGRKNRNRYSYSRPITWLRITFLIVFIAAFFAGIGWLVAVLAPYSAYGRMVSSFLSPVYIAVNNLLASLSESMGNYAFYRKDPRFTSIPVMVTAGITLLLIFILAWRNGRTYCNTVCPVGTFLGFFSRFSLFRPAIDTDKCTSCGLCARRCKASCIDPEKHQIDYSRCVTCMDCLDNCSQNAISYSLKNHSRSLSAENTVEKTPDAGRRNFLVGAGTVLLASALSAKEKAVDGGLAKITDKIAPDRRTPILPAGALSLRNLTSHCTACQLCISSCPNDVLRPSDDMEMLMQPVASYEKGYCRPECTRCSEICPTGAIIPTDVARKSSIQVGHAVWIKDNCLPLTEGVECVNCARHCPSGAISMIPSKSPDGKEIKIPVIDTEFCIGCGACEYLCPSRPFSAIYVEGHKIHRTL